jgi:putative nucleotidyltransferase with HDIG domain
MNRNLWNGQVDQFRLWVRRHSLALFFAIVALGMTLILSYDLPGTRQVDVAVDRPAPNDLFSSRSLTFTSDLLTAQARDQAARAVSDIYTPLDLQIGRTQLAQARSFLAFVDTVRADSSATPSRKIAYLRAAGGLTISEEVADGLLSLTQAEYEQVKADVLAIIEELMREEIRPSQLADYQRTARRLASLELSAAQTSVVTELAYQFILPTVFPDDEATAAARAAAAEAVQPVTRSVARDQRIVRAGEIVTAADYELLTELGLLRQEANWRHTASMAVASLLTTSLIALYWARFQRVQFPNGRYLGVVAGLLLLFTAVAKIMLNSDLLAYWFPLTALSLLLAVVYDTRFAMLVTVLMAGLVGFAGPNSLEVAIYLAMGGVVSVLTLRDAQRISAFFRAGLLAAIGYATVIVMFWLLEDASPRALLLPAAYALGNGMLSSGLTLAGLYVLGGLFGIVTILQLQDLSRLDHPLLRELLRRAPGTYHHSIMVANLAEQAAERVNANSTLVRVGAFYHDVGKMVRPPFFVENQEGMDPHASLDPHTSARIVISHVADGLELARRYRLPFRIRDIIAQHHGNRVVRSFYRKAQEMAGEGVQVDPEAFRYPGPRPNSREAAIVMLADAIDATSTAVRPNTEKAIEKLINTIVEDDLLEGQLNGSGLTLGDIEQLRLSFIETLKGRFHVRVQYPGNELLIGDNLPELVLPPPPPALPEPPRPEAALPEPRPRATQTANSG